MLTFHCKKIYCFKWGSLLRDGAFFCGNCGTLRKNIIHDPNGSLNSLIKYYFRKEMAYETVVDACWTLVTTFKLALEL